MWMDEYLETWKAWRGYREEGWVGLAREAWFATRNPSRFMMMPNWADAMDGGRVVYAVSVRLRIGVVKMGWMDG